MGMSPYIAMLREKIGNDLLLLPTVSAIIIDDQGCVLLQRSVDDGKWYTLGGSMEPRRRTSRRSGSRGAGRDRPES